jgi:hypothetical protein
LAEQVTAISTAVLAAGAIGVISSDLIRTMLGTRVADRCDRWGAGDRRHRRHRRLSDAQAARQHDARR